MWSMNFENLTEVIKKMSTDLTYLHDEKRYYRESARIDSFDDCLSNSKNNLSIAIKYIEEALKAEEQENDK